MEDVKWFVACVHTNTEQQTAKHLDAMGIENYVPAQTVLRVRKSGRKVKSLRNVIPGMVFVRCSDEMRRTRVVSLSTVLRFLSDRTKGKSHVAEIPDSEIELLRFMVGQSEIPVSFERESFAKGMKVRVIRGPLQGLAGEVVETNHDNSEITVRLENLGCARLSISTADLITATD